MALAPASCSSAAPVPEIRITRAFGYLETDHAARGGAVQPRHPVIHQHHVRLVTRVGLDGFEAGADDLDDFMTALRDERSQGGANASLIIGNQDAHGVLWQKFARRSAEPPLMEVA